MATPAPKPLVLAMIVCDQFYRDPATGKLSILGCLASHLAPVFPCQHPGVGVLVTITDTVGPVTMRVQVVDAEGDRPPVARSEISAMVRDPRDVGDYIFNLRPLVFPSPNEYRVQAFCNDEFLCERRLSVRLGGRPPRG